MNKIIAFSGQNGCGKSTIIKMVKDTFDLNGVTCDVLKSPDYSTDSGKKIKAFLEGAPIDLIEELFTLNRMEVQQRIFESDAQVILLDRWTLDALAYAEKRGTKANIRD